MIYASMGLLTFSAVLVAVLQRWSAIRSALLLYVVAVAGLQAVTLGPGPGLLNLTAGLVAIGVLQKASAPEPSSRTTNSEPPVEESLAQLGLLVAVAVTLVVAYGLTIFWPLSGAGVLSFAWYWLLGIGSLVLITARVVFRRGVGLLLLLGATSTLQSGLTRAVDPGFLLASALAQVLLALIVARITTVGREVTAK